MLALVVVLLMLAILGHWALWLTVSNRFHATGLPRSLLKAVSLGVHSMLFLGPLLLGVWCFSLPKGAMLVGPPEGAMQAGAWSALPLWLAVYGAACWAMAMVTFAKWVARTHRATPPSVLLSNHTTTFDFSDRVAALSAKGHASSAKAPVPSEKGRVGRLARLPGNESLQLDVNEKRIVLPQLDPRLEGLSIAHLSDLHFTGAIPCEFFELVVAQANEMQADLIAVTGDVLDSDACLPWVIETLSKLQSRHGAYFILGNHDRTVDSAQLRETLIRQGLVDLGGRWVELSINDCPVVLAGNELPWFRPAANLHDCPPLNAPQNAQLSNGAPRPLSVLLSHSPDQIAWARRREIDLMLAGHTHGGQIRLPVLGPIVAPSRYGVKYASGTFHEPPTVMHVSRGLSGRIPLRYNCRPELTKLVLTPGPR